MQMEKSIKKSQTTVPFKDTVLVTGGAGKLGKYIISALLEKGVSVRALVKDREDVHNLPSGTIPFVGDITSQDLIIDACKGVDTIYHLAAIVSQRVGGHKEILRVNTEGTKILQEAADLSGVKKLILASTVDVYGSKRKELLTEESIPKPTDVYGHSKLLAEKQVISFHGNISYTILRMSAIYGENYKHSFFKIFKMIDNNKAYMIGKGNNSLSLIHIKDVARAMLLVRENSKSNNKIYNLSDGKSYTQEYLFKLASELLGKTEKIKSINEFIARILSKQANINVDDLRFITSNRLISIEKITNELGFHPNVDIKSGTKELIQLYKASKGN
ncbi:MAG: NAD(P)-dependent oxidoreductase [Candidatus Micrarchaeaceae archaeon]